jgi:chromosome partitioning protein
MKNIMIINPKGGCGKSTISTNLAGYFANWNIKVTLADLDEQKSSLEWLRARSTMYPRIHGISAWTGEMAVPPDTEIIIMDTPAGIHHMKELSDMIQVADVLLIPVLPSPIDIRAAAKFIHELLLVHKVSRTRTKIGIVANRVRINTLAYKSLERFVNALSIPFITGLRMSRNYLMAADKGLSIFDLPPKQVEHDIRQWLPLIKWLSDEDTGKSTKASD